MRRHLSTALIAIFLFSANPFVRDDRGDRGDRSLSKIVRHILHKLVPGSTDELTPPKP
jgi:hypothetical protein